LRTFKFQGVIQRELGGERKLDWMDSIKLSGRYCIRRDNTRTGHVLVWNWDEDCGFWVITKAAGGLSSAPGQPESEMRIQLNSSILPALCHSLPGANEVLPGTITKFRLCFRFFFTLILSFFVFCSCHKQCSLNAGAGTEASAVGGGRC